MCVNSSFYCLSDWACTLSRSLCRPSQSTTAPSWPTVTPPSKTRLSTSSAPGVLPAVLVSQVKSLEADPELAAIFEDIKKNGMEAAMKYYQDEAPGTVFVCQYVCLLLFSVILFGFGSGLGTKERKACQQRKKGRESKEGRRE